MGNFVSNDNATSLVTKVGNCLDIRPKTWTGTHDEWTAMSAADQAKYEYVNFTDDYEQGGGGGGGHVIEDATGTDLTQRANLQFKGVRVSDDSTNDRTVVDATNETIEWSSWIAMTDAQQEAYLEAHPNLTVLNAPYEDADIPFMTKLWENPSPTTEFASQDITLSSDDYDFLLILSRYKNNSPRIADSIILPKGSNVFTSFADTVGTTAANIYRSITRVSDTSYTISDAYLNGAVSNVMLIPVTIYGLKKSVSINAIAANVSTSASKCMMSDDETSVEEAIDREIKIEETIETLDTIASDGLVSITATPPNDSSYNWSVYSVVSNTPTLWFIGYYGSTISIYNKYTSTLTNRPIYIRWIGKKK